MFKQIISMPKAEEANHMAFWIQLIYNLNWRDLKFRNIKVGNLKSAHCRLYSVETLLSHENSVLKVYSMSRYSEKGIWSRYSGIFSHKYIPVVCYLKSYSKIPRLLQIRGDQRNCSINNSTILCSNHEQRWI